MAKPTSEVVASARPKHGHYVHCVESATEVVEVVRNCLPIVAAEGE